MSKFDSSDVTISFVNELDSTVKSQLDLQLREFSTRHASRHCPVALVTSGGTAADLEVNSVRVLDNFSTGLRGAISVEEFLRRGYAVIHLTRTGSASPYARVLGQAIGLSQANHGLSLASIGKLFAGDLEEEDEDQLVQHVLDDEQQNRSAQDPWMTDAHAQQQQHAGGQRPKSRSKNSDSIVLHRRIINSSRLQTALQERSKVLQEGRLLTVTFKSVEEYLAKLQLCAESLRDCQSLALLYLAAAVSDFYVPKAHRSQHKIQSKDFQGDDGILLKLYPVPKVLGLLRNEWAPDAFMCSFKLETDKSILREKAERAVKKYGCHLVIGNLLQTRHSQVWVLGPPTQQDQTDDNGPSADLASIHDWPLHGITKPRSSEPDALESMLIDHVVQTHFEYISVNYDKSGAEAMVRAHDELRQKRQQYEREIFWKSMQQTALEWAGVVLGGVLSYVISSALRRRMNG